MHCTADTTMYNWGYLISPTIFGNLRKKRS